MTYEVQQTRWDRLIRRVSGSIGPGSRVSETLSELFPVLDVENVPAELLFLSGAVLGQGAQELVQSAGDFDLIQIFNPVDSGKLVTLTQVILNTNASQNIRFGTTEVALTNDVGNVIPRDTRGGIILRLSAQIRSVQQVAGFPQFGILRLEAGVSYTLQDQNALVVLAPGTGYTFATTQVNSTLRASFWWRERGAEESELSF